MTIVRRLITMWLALPKAIREKIIDRVIMISLKAKEKFQIWNKDRKAKKKDPFIY